MLQITELFQQSYSWFTCLVTGENVSQENPPIREQRIKKVSKENLPPSLNNQESTTAIKRKKISDVPIKKRARKEKQNVPTIKVDADIQDEEMAAYFMKCWKAQGRVNPADYLKSSSHPVPSDNCPEAIKPSIHSPPSPHLVKMSAKGDLCRVKSMDKMPEIEKRPTQEDYHKLIQFNIKKSQLEHAYDLLLDMRAHHLPIDRLVCHALLDALAKQKKIQKMEALLEEMKKAKIRMNEVTYNILIHGYCKNHQLKRALECLHEMKANGLSPNLITYNTLLTAYSEQDMIEEVSSLLDEMQCNQIKLNKITYNIAINAYMRVNNLEISSRLFKQSNLSLIITYEKRLVILDCHTLSHGSACIGLHHYLKNNIKIRKFCVITGIGKHSKNAQMYQMRDCIKEFLKKFYPYFKSYIQSHNPGRLYCEKLVRTN